MGTMVVSQFCSQVLIDIVLIIIRIRVLRVVENISSANNAHRVRQKMLYTNVFHFEVAGNSIFKVYQWETNKIAWGGGG